jgi:hypothetical protein
VLLVLGEDELAVAEDVELAVVASACGGDEAFAVQLVSEAHGPLVVAASGRAIEDLDAHASETLHRGIDGVMGVTLTVRDQTGTRATSELTLPELSEHVTVRELIRTRVREEVAKVNAAPERDFRTLVRPSDAEQVLNGFRLRRPKPVDWERQAKVAEDGFRRNAFFVLVDGRQVEELDEELALTADSDVRFVKLVPLVGG